MIKNSKQARRQKIRYRIRKKVRGTEECPRLAVYKSNRFFSAQLIDDDKGHTLIGVDSKKLGGKNASHVTKVAEMVAGKILEKKINKFVADRSGYQYHGRVKLFFEKVKENMLKK